MTVRKQGQFSARDRELLGLEPGATWIPKDPIDLILPYMEKEPNEEETDLEARRKVAAQVVDAYGDIIRRCEEIEEEISVQAKDVTIPLSPDTHYSVQVACERVFGIPAEEVTEITFEMYKAVVQAMAEVSDPGTLTL